MFTSRHEWLAVLNLQLKAKNGMNIKGIPEEISPEGLLRSAFGWGRTPNGLFRPLQR